MDRLVYKHVREPEEHSDDIDRMVSVAAANECALDRDDADALWRTYSDMFAAGWLFLPAGDDELWGVMQRHTTRIPSGSLR